MIEFNDDTKMPFGTHKGKKLSEMPHGYFKYVYHNYSRKIQTNTLTNFEKKLLTYIDKNFNF